MFQIEDLKPENEHINLKVTGQDGSVVHFKIKKNTPLRKLMGAYCNRAVSVYMSNVLHSALSLFCGVTFSYFYSFDCPTVVVYCRHRLHEKPWWEPKATKGFLSCLE